MKNLSIATCALTLTAALTLPSAAQALPQFTLPSKGRAYPLKPVTATAIPRPTWQQRSFHVVKREWSKVQLGMQGSQNFMNKRTAAFFATPQGQRVQASWRGLSQRAAQVSQRLHLDHIKLPKAVRSSMGLGCFMMPAILTAMNPDMIITMPAFYVMGAMMMRDNPALAIW